MDQLPPGITGNAKHLLSGAEEGALQWREIKTVKHYTNAFIVQDGKVRSSGKFSSKYQEGSNEKRLDLTGNEEKRLGYGQVRLSPFTIKLR
jgi:hypothetical protein